MITTSFKLPNDCGNKRYSKGLRLTQKKILSKGCELLMYSRDINLGGKMGRLSFFWEDAKHVEGPYNRPPPHPLDKMSSSKCWSNVWKYFTKNETPSLSLNSIKGQVQ